MNLEEQRNDDNSGLGEGEVGSFPETLTDPTGASLTLFTQC